MSSAALRQIIIASTACLCEESTDSTTKQSRGARKTNPLALLALHVAVAVAPISHAGSADAFPNKAVRIGVPFPAGGGVDATARVVGQKLAEQWGQPVV